MARGHQKIQSQAKTAEKQAKMKKQQGHSANDQKKAAQKALVHVCVLDNLLCNNIPKIHIDVMSICLLSEYTLYGLS